MTFLLAVIASLIVFRLAELDHYRRRRLFFEEMQRRQDRLGPVVPTIWSRTILNNPHMRH
jgi:hypothetical protein